jgi:hypothetical protein
MILHDLVAGKERGVTNPVSTQGKGETNCESWVSRIIEGDYAVYDGELNNDPSR